MTRMGELENEIGHPAGQNRMRAYPHDSRVSSAAGMRRVFFGLLAAGLLGLLPASSSAAITDPKGTDMTVQIAKMVAGMPGVVVLDNTRLRLLPVGWSRSEINRAALGERLGADVLILVDEQRDAFAYIDAQTGEELFKIREDSPDDLPRSAASLVEELRDIRPFKVPIVLVLKDPAPAKRGIFLLRPDYFDDCPIP